MRSLTRACLPLGCWAAFAGCEAPVPGSVTGVHPAAPRSTNVPVDTGSPPPISGGTLLVTSDGLHAVASDPDTDRVVIVDLTRRAVAAALPLHPGDEPGRLVEDGAGRVHVVLRGGGAVQTVLVRERALGPRRAVCAAPRGVAWERADDRLHVACLDGSLVTLPAADGAPTRRLQLARDLRDVVVLGGDLLVTRFRAAEALVVSHGGEVVSTLAVPAAAGQQAAAVAWRAVAAPSGGAWVLHQRTGNAPQRPIYVTAPGYYTSSTVRREVACPGTTAITRPGLTRVRPPYDPEVLPDLGGASLAVDVAVEPRTGDLAVAVPGNAWSPMRQVLVVPASQTGPCLTAEPQRQPADGQVIAVAWGPGGALAVQTRSPAAVYLPRTEVTVPLGGPLVRNAGHAMFHTHPGGAVTCASCHAEGDDDGRTWTFAPTGPRRTLSLRGGVTDTAPFHWSGELPDLDALVAEVGVRGMGLPIPERATVASLGHWLDGLAPRPRPAVEAASAARGERLFHDPAVACATCHAGPKLTNHQTVDVGTGEALQVPPLQGVVWRAPYMHDGCAATLRDRFTEPCGGGDRHGHTSQLSAAELDDLVAYLETL